MNYFATKFCTKKRNDIRFAHGLSDGRLVFVRDQHDEIGELFSLYYLQDQDRRKTMSDTIEVHKGYRLVGEMRDWPDKFCYVAGRQGDVVTLYLVTAVVTAEVQDFGREFAKVVTPDGVYNLMPCNEAKTDEDFEGVVAAIDGLPDEDEDETARGGEISQSAREA